MAWRSIKSHSPERGNGSLLLEVGNRGNKLTRFFDANQALTPGNSATLQQRWSCRPKRCVLVW